MFSTATDLRSPAAYAAVTPPRQTRQASTSTTPTAQVNSGRSAPTGRPPSLLIDASRAAPVKPPSDSPAPTRNKLFPALRDTPLARAEPASPPERFQVAPDLTSPASSSASSATPPATAASALPAPPETASAPPAIPVPAAQLPQGYLLPQGLFAPAQTTLVPLANNNTAEPAPSPALADELTPRALPPEIVIYASPGTRRFLAAGGVDYQQTLDVWTDFLQRHGLPHRLVEQTEGLASAVDSVWIFPSSIALSAEERRLVTQHRGRGGSILASWLTGVRSEQGEWTGFSFLENELDTQVEGNTESFPDHTFLIPHGDSPLSSQLPAGRRMFMERVTQWHPLRLKGRQTAAHLLDWSRTLPEEASTAVFTYNERRGRDSSAHNSRSAVIGFPERLWSGDPSAIEAMVRDALLWLQRRPQAHLAAWPAPYRSALTVGIDITENLTGMAESHLIPLGAIGGKASLFVLPEALKADLQASRPALPGLLAAGHELAYFGDRFEAYKDQDEATQKARLMAMEQQIAELLPKHRALRSFHAPMEAYDNATLQLLPTSVDQVVDGPGVSEARLPELRTVTEGFAPLVMLPRTLRPLDDLPESSALKSALAEFNHAVDSGALTYVALRSSGSFQTALWRLYLEQVAQRKEQLWLATVGEIGHWWRERERISVSFDDKESPPLLSITVKGSTPLQHPAGVIVTLPQAGADIRAQATTQQAITVSAQRRSPWQTTLSFSGLTPGTHHWRLHFTASASSLAKQLGLDAAGSLRLSR